MRNLFLLLIIQIAFIGSISAQKFESGKVIFKIKPSYKNKCLEKTIAIPEFQKTIKGIGQISKIFPSHPTSNNKNIPNGGIDLSTIYEIQFPSEIPPSKIIAQLLKREEIEYAEPVFSNHLIYTPNDSMNVNQYYLDAIHAYEAWDIEQGDTSVVIAIVDTGSDTDHVDLKGAFAYNTLDPINGVDDDNDGYIDNYYGWDVANNDNDVNFNLLGHGTNVAGIASASTDNLFGISGTGFNTRILTVKIDDENTGVLTKAYQGIVYAADHGAFVINNSWGGTSYSKFGEDIVNYAAINKGCLLVAGAGNNSNEVRFYPAAYENVMAIGATKIADTLKNNSNFGHWVDLFAPGDNMLTCNAAGKYGYAGGTSMASPVIAGCAGLLKSHFPSYSAEQIREQLLNTADNIEAVNLNIYNDKLGTGRVNVFRALTDTSKPGIRFMDMQFTDNNDNAFFEGDTIRISGVFKNFLSPASGITVTLTDPSNTVQILTAQKSLGSMNNMDTINISNDPFLAYIPSGTNFNQTIEFKMEILAGTYKKVQYFILSINNDFITVNENKLKATISSSGGIGFTGSSNNLGHGISYLSDISLLYEGSFIIGNSPQYVADKFRATGSTDDDFRIVSPVQFKAPQKADIELEAIFDDSNISNPAQLEITQKNYIFNQAIGGKTIIYVYHIKNLDSYPANNLYAGMIMDWDIHNYSNNKISEDSSRKMGISYATDTNLYCGIKLLTLNKNFNHYGIDNTPSGEGGILAYYGLNDSLKFELLRQNRAVAGNSSSAGNDIMDVISAGPFQIKGDSSIAISFAIIISDSLSDLNKEADSIQQVFNLLSLGELEISKESSLQNGLELYPNPGNEKIHLKFYLPKTQTLQFQVFEASGRLVYSPLAKKFSKGNQLTTLSTSSLKNGLYFLKVFGSDINFQNTFVVSFN